MLREGGRAMRVYLPRMIFVILISLSLFSLVNGTIWDLRVSSPDFTLYGADSGDNLGRRVIVADVDEDGYEDIIVAASLADGPANNRNNAGEVYIIYGGNLPQVWDLSTQSADFVVYGRDTSDFLDGIFVGDLNGDGLPDLVLGAPGGDGPQNDRPGAGEVYILYGGNFHGERDLSTNPPEFEVFGADTGDGLNASFVADLNGDGIDDLILSAFQGDGPNETREDAGEIYIFYGGNLYGSLDLRVDAPDILIYGMEADDKLSIGIAGDVNGDEAIDLVATAYRADGPENGRPNTGEVYVLYDISSYTGVVDLSVTSPDYIIYGRDPNDYLGRYFSLLDTNGDGRDDIIIGAPLADGPENGRPSAGEVYLIYGGDLIGEKDLLNSPADFTVYGADEDDRLGGNLRKLDDIDGDLRGDLLLYSYRGDGPENTREESGEWYLFYGNDLQGEFDLAYQSPPWTFYAVDSGDGGDGYYPTCMRSCHIAVGNILGDEHPDLILSSGSGDGPNNERFDAGELYVLDLFGPTEIEEFVGYDIGKRESSTVSILPSGIKVNLHLNKPSLIKVSLYDLSGRKVTDLVGNKRMGKGAHSLIFEIGDVATGVYILSLEIDGMIEREKVLLLR